MAVMAGRRQLGLGRWLGALGLLLGAWTVAGAQGANVVREIRLGPEVVEIELESTEEFPVISNVTVLRIGDKEFLLNRAPADGSLHRLIFMIPAAEYAGLGQGAAMRLYHGREVARGRDFGRLDKGQGR